VDPVGPLLLQLLLSQFGWLKEQAKATCPLSSSSTVLVAMETTDAMEADTTGECNTSEIEELPLCQPTHMLEETKLAKQTQDLSKFLQSQI